MCMVFLLHVQGGRRGGLMVNALKSRATVQVRAPARDVVLCCVYTLVYKWVPVNLMQGVTLQCTGIVYVCVYPIQGGVEIFLVTSCCWNQDKLRPDGPRDSYTDLALPYMYNCSLSHCLLCFIWVDHLFCCQSLAKNSTYLCYKKINIYSVVLILICKVHSKYTCSLVLTR